MTDQELSDLEDKFKKPIYEPTISIDTTFNKINYVQHLFAISQNHKAIDNLPSLHFNIQKI